jgi:polyhydroxybutyrate depolymerase
MTHALTKFALVAVSLSLVTTATYGRDHPLRDRIQAMRAAHKGDPRVSNAGTKGALSAPTLITINQGGVSREALVQSPAGSLRPRGLVIVLHGGTRPASDIFDRSSWPEIAARENVVLVAPQGLNNQWNDGRDATISGTASSADDVGFLAALIDTMVRDYHVDRNAVFISGASNGGLMTMRFSCDRPDQVIAMAPVIAALPQSQSQSCGTGKAVPALFMAGTADPIMTFDGSPSTRSGKGGSNVPMLSIPQTVALWRDRNGCGAKESSKTFPDLDRSDRSTVTSISYGPCRTGASVALFRVDGGGHQQPSLSRSGSSALLTSQLGPQNHDVDGPEQIWAFFKSVSGRSITTPVQPTPRPKGKLRDRIRGQRGGSPS